MAPTFQDLQAFVLAVEKVILAGIAGGQPVDFGRFLDRNGAGFPHA
ncbi:MAG TPA: hypothetical protein VNL35_21685 [Chloroflexota bacterium]|nr:hypothetical protein [Chloroflexota bacterium]